MTKRIGIIGGGIAGLTAAWQLSQLAREGAGVEATLFESSPRLGGIVETVQEDGFVVECGPDAWVTEKPWARELAVELGLEGELLSSNDATRKTHILIEGRLEAMPDGMRMMVPSDLDAIDRSPIFTALAKQAFHDERNRADELLAAAPQHDESIASFTRRHFGQEVLTRIAAPLLSGVLGGDVETLSVQAVMPQFVAMERTHGSLIAALQSRASQVPPPIFTTLRSGLGTLLDRLNAGVPRSSLHLDTSVCAISRSGNAWQLHIEDGRPSETVHELLLAVPSQIAQSLLRPLDPAAADLLSLESSSAIVVALGYADAGDLKLPSGFGLLVPPFSQNQLLACTFVDQKFAHRVPPGAGLLRAFFGGKPAQMLLQQSDEHLANLAQVELTRILGPLPTPTLTLVRRWPQSLPQYAVGHLTRMSALENRISALPGLTLLGNAYRGVGLPDLIRDARAAARQAARTPAA